MTGQSGATFTVVKRGRMPRVIERLRWQWRWLALRRAYPELVTVGDWRGDGYEMELLDPIPGSWTSGFGQPTVDEILRLLRPVWAEPPSYSWWRASDADAWPVLLAWRRGITVGDHHYGSTHGDPTRENVLRRPTTRTLVLIDPVPDAVAAGRVPAVRALDLGKILQSGLGYEAVRAGERDAWYPIPEIVAAVKRACVDEDEWQLARWCAALNIVRLIPYKPHGQRWERWFPDIVTYLREGIY